MLNPDFHDILSVFCEERVDFLVVGAYALAAHGAPRATGDIDLWVRSSPANAKRVLRALARFGAPVAELTEADLQASGTVFQIGVAPRRIDVLTSVTGVSFEVAWPRRLEVGIDGLRVPVIGREDLLANKKATGRLKDRADVQAIEDQSAE